MHSLQPFSHLAALKHKMPYPIQQHYSRHDYPRKLEYRDLVPGLCHARQPRSAALQRAPEGGKRLRCAVDDMLVARAVVDVDGHAPQGRHFARELVQPRVVLSARVLAAVCAVEGQDVLGGRTVRARRLATWLRLRVCVLFLGCLDAFPGVDRAWNVVDAF